MNIRQLLPPVIAFVIACTGSTGTIIMRANLALRADSATAAAAAADSAHNAQRDADSLDVSAHDSTDHAPDSIAAPKTPVTLAPVADSIISKIAEPGQPTVTPTPASVTPSLMPDGRLAKLFAAMPARDAAKVFDQMSDADVIALLGEMTDKRAAEVLALLPPARSAVIARSVLARTRSS